MSAADAHRTADPLLDTAIHRLRRKAPHLSAHRRLTPWQAITTIMILAAGAGLAIGMPHAARHAAIMALSLLFFSLALLRVAGIFALWRTANNQGVQAAQSDTTLPVYTVLCPLLREAAIVPQLLRALEAIDYPLARLDIKLIVEADDHHTHAAIRRELAESALVRSVDVVQVPPAEPRTKPKALNYALQTATGQLIVIFDAEDIPQPPQLRRAASVFLSAEPRLACLQAVLSIDNIRQSWLTRQFAMEYMTIFRGWLPALERLGLPIPLGGTSNHFRIEALRAVGGWDPYNVTEDADLGLRLARAGYRTGTLSCATYEEAPHTFSGWMKQRTRWMKGWLQTFFVHNRTALRLMREVGLWRFTGFQIVIGGVLLAALVHPWFYVFAGLALWQGTWFSPPDPSDVMAMLVLWAAAASLLAGYASAILFGAVAWITAGRSGMAIHALFIPVYWLLISLAAYRAIWQFCTQPFRWEKTTHGRAQRDPAERLPVKRPSNVRCR